MSRTNTAREALIAEALGDVARLLDRLEALMPALDEAQRAQRQASKALAAQAQDFEIRMLPEYPANPGGRELVKEMKARINDIFAEFGATHMQIGKSYPYMRGREQNAAALLKAIKQQVDPAGLMNPGGLGL